MSLSNEVAAAPLIFFALTPVERELFFVGLAGKLEQLSPQARWTDPSSLKPPARQGPATIPGALYTHPPCPVSLSSSPGSENDDE